MLDRSKVFAATDAVAKNPQIPWLPSQSSYVITCIDSRTEPAGFLGVDLGDATVQRTVGGRVTHTDCGSTLLADPELRRRFAARGCYIEAELAWLPATDPVGQH